ncbi:hypothetical protein Misp01_16560 [Microtetraspora sp. NBRC 13810]|nr:hypothetical protein Misp01_16560 [Microtetraspora sp. NBRC 13810]
MPLGGDVDMPLLGFGTWQLRGRQAYEATLAALEVGYRHIDTATMYANETEVGRALRDSGLDRGDVFVTTKLPPGNVGRVRETIRRSLDDLGTDYVDLWLVHWPPGRDELVRTWEEFLAVQESGLARAVGVSNYSPAQIDRVTGPTGRAPAVNQIPWSPSGHDAALLAEHRDRGVAVEGYSSLKETDLRAPRPDRNRVPARRDARPGRPALASRTRHRHDPQVVAPRPHRGELRPLRLLPRQGRHLRHRRPVVLTPPCRPRPLSRGFRAVSPFPCGSRAVRPFLTSYGVGGG